MLLPSTPSCAEDVSVGPLRIGYGRESFELTPRRRVRDSGGGVKQHNHDKQNTNTITGLDFRDTLSYEKYLNQISFLFLTSVPFTFGICAPG